MVLHELAEVGTETSDKFEDDRGCCCSDADLLTYRPRQFVIADSEFDGGFFLDREAFSEECYKFFGGLSGDGRIDDGEGSD